MYKIKEIASGIVYDVQEPPQYDPSMRQWLCGDLNFIDFSGDLYEVVLTPPPILQGRKRVSRPEFKQLLMASERIAIRTARAYAGDNAQLLGLKAVLDDLFDILEDPALTYVDLTLPTTIEGVHGLAAAGLVAPERVSVILAGWPD
jgi:hypothetical protein